MVTIKRYIGKIRKPLHWKGRKAFLRFAVLPALLAVALLLAVRMMVVTQYEMPYNRYDLDLLQGDRLAVNRLAYGWTTPLPRLFGEHHVGECLPKKGDLVAFASPAGNDQVLVDLKLFTRDKIREVAEAVRDLFAELQQQSERYKNVLMPGYTHLQVAMPSSFGLWFGAYAESLADDMLLLEAAYRMTNRNPLGSAAGYGSSFPLNRTMTTELLGFDSMDYNVVYAQMGRGKNERNVAFALAGIAGTVAKLAFDACMFNSQNFGFVRLPDECTTGSSIMPHKKNPDVFELIRARCNKLQALPTQVVMIMNNLPCGYFRDLQEIKEVFLPAFDQLLSCLRMATYIVARMRVNEHILDDARYDLMFSVEEVNRLASEGMPFRDAYKKVGLDIEAHQFTPNKEIHHTHEGSIGNLCNDRIAALMQATYARFGFERVSEAEKKLLGGE